MNSFRYDFTRANTQKSFTFCAIQADKLEDVRSQNKSMKRFSEQGLKSRAEQNYDLFNSLQTDDAGFKVLREMLKTWTGIQLTDGSASQLKMANRLTRVLCKHEINSYRQYAKLLKGNDPALIAEFISAMTTNTTRFFREAPHFEALKDILAETVERKKRESTSEIRIWCAATSTGEEAYTLAISAKEGLQAEPNFKLKLLATDIDLGALERAAEGVYSEQRLSELPPELLRKYFTRTIGSSAQKAFKVQPSIQRLIHFAPFNLHTEPYPFERGFDVIFCRNVLIYFSRENAQAIIEKLTGSLNPGGFLFVGHSEVGYVRSQGLRMREYSIYQKLG